MNERHPEFDLDTLFKPAGDPRERIGQARSWFEEAYTAFTQQLDSCFADDNATAIQALDAGHHLWAVSLDVAMDMRDESNRLLNRVLEGVNELRGE